MKHMLGKVAKGSCVLLVAVQLGGCAAEGAGAASIGRGPSEEWQLSAEPLLEIGVVAFDDAYQLHDAVSSLRLEDGRIVVLNAGSHQIRFYNAGGRFMRAVGGRGSGPGEFRRPERIYAHAADSILAYDAGLARESWFDENGDFVRTAPVEPGANEHWTRDAWLYGRSYVDGPRSPTQRGPVRAALARMPSPTSGFRYVMVDPRGRLWVRREPVDATVPTEWVVHRRDGSPLARATTPASFEPQHIGDNFVLGRARDAMNVEFIRLYRFDAPSMRSADHVLASASNVHSPQTAPPSEDVRKHMQSVLRSMMSQQELYYSRPENGYRYASRSDQLEWPEDMTDLEVHILRGDARGWTALLFHRTEPIGCGVTTGVGGPIGWTPGVVVCG